jgi:two-component system sensor histidine kinase SenX3
MVCSAGSPRADLSLAMNVRSQTSLFARIGIRFAILAIATAVPVLISPLWGLIPAVAIAACGAAWIARGIRERYVRPVERLAEMLREKTPGGSTEDLAAQLVSEYRDAVNRMDETLSQTRRREAALEHSTEAVVLIDPDGRVDYANPRARDILHGHVLDLSRRLLQPDLERLVERAREVMLLATEDVVLYVPGPRHARALAIPFADGSLALLLSDLEESRRLDQVRRDFVANVSHELKTPVAGIRALAETAATAFAADDLSTARRFIERLGTEATRLSGLVSDLLDLSRVEVGAELQMASVELVPLLTEAADRARTVAEVKDIELDVVSPEMVIEADPSQLSMAIKNLVDNAVRYSEGGKVHIQAECRPGWLAVTVTDQGIGIPSAEIPRIFERFYRVDKARSRATGGTGLGLAIVRHVAENHGGKVEVSSELGVGSTFTLLIPVGKPSTNGNGTAGWREAPPEN